MLFITGVELSDEKELMRNFSNFVLKKFLSSKVLNSSLIHIRLISRNSLPKEERKEFTEAAAWMTDDGVVNGKKHFTITLDQNSVNNFTLSSS